MRDLKREIAEAICTLNRWETPEGMKHMGRDLTKDEVRVAMLVLQEFVPYSEWILVWREQIEELGKEKK